MNRGRLFLFQIIGSSSKKTPEILHRVKPLLQFLSNSAPKSLYRAVCFQISMGGNLPSASQSPTFCSAAAHAYPIPNVTPITPTRRQSTRNLGTVSTSTFSRFFLILILPHSVGNTSNPSPSCRFLFPCIRQVSPERPYLSQSPLPFD